MAVNNGRKRHASSHPYLVTEQLLESELAGPHGLVQWPGQRSSQPKSPLLCAVVDSDVLPLGDGARKVSSTCALLKAYPKVSAQVRNSQCQLVFMLNVYGLSLRNENNYGVLTSLYLHVSEMITKKKWPKCNAPFYFFGS